MVALRLILSMRKWWAMLKVVAGWQRERAGSMKQWWKTYAIGVLIGFDCMMNAVFAGSHRQTLSSRFYRMWQNRDCVHCRVIGYALCRVLHWIDKDHCEDAWANSPIAKDLTTMEKEQHDVQEKD